MPRRRAVPGTGGAVFFGPDNDTIERAHEAPAWVKTSPFIAMLIGALVAYWFYIVNPELPMALARQQPVLYRFLLNKWYFDEIYDFLFVRPAIWLGNAALEGRRRRRDRRHANGIAMGDRALVHPARRAGAVGLSLPLCLRDGAGARGADALARHRGGGLMNSLLSLITFLPLIGAVVLLVFLRGRRRDGAAERQAPRALHHQRHLPPVALLLSGYDPSNPGFQFVEERPWLGGLTYRMGIDGISILFLMLTTFLMPL